MTHGVGRAINGECHFFAPLADLVLGAAVSGGVTSARGIRVAHRRPIQCKAVSGVHETVEDGIGDRGICDQLVPVLDGDL